MIRSLRALHLVCDCLRTDAAAGHRQRLRKIDDATWSHAIALANEHLVGPALHAALERTGRLADIPDAVHDYLALLHQSNAARNDCLRQQALELIDALGNAGVDALLLKGGATLFSAPTPSARMIRDLDLLVPRHAADRVFATFDNLGYRAIARYPAGHHAYGDFARPGEPGAVDLHFELIDTPHVLPAQDVWRRADQIVVQGRRFFVPSPTDRVLHNVLHAQVHFLANYYRGAFELRQLHEFASFTRDDPPGTDWTFIAGSLTQHHLRTPLHAYALLAHRLLDAPWKLPGAPAVAARLQMQRCLLQHRVPILARWGTPLANVQSAFAPHRMAGLYGQQSPLLQRRLHHASRFLRKRDAGDWIARLLRSEAHPRGWRR
ncbi:nucleotidyltransferase family protein [Vineibacter terrae]|uniref:nucleotidyltransferase domain-containing protein n=1 Tax=Vineibacter terrae TaxID=2586908 RepID=UPI002E31A936|nr:nucleotidyltransferase family protein [Vineibacter terrae]HEX2889955.1 nucleotidyltransferase family protein [Vineibacter terrae]